MKVWLQVSLVTAAFKGEVSGENKESGVCKKERLSKDMPDSAGTVQNGHLAYWGWYGFPLWWGQTSPLVGMWFMGPTAQAHWWKQNPVRFGEV